MDNTKLSVFFNLLAEFGHTKETDTPERVEQILLTTPEQLKEWQEQAQKDVDEDLFCDSDSIKNVAAYFSWSGYWKLYISKGSIALYEQLQEDKWAFDDFVAQADALAKQEK